MPSSRQRVSQSVATPSRPSGGFQIPEYQPLRNPLNDKAAHALNTLLDGSIRLTRLKERLAHSQTQLAKAVGEVNDRNTGEQTSLNQRRQKKKEIDRGRERYAEKLDDRTKVATGKLEEGMRLIIDGESKVGALEAGVKEASRGALASSVGGARARAASQMQRRRERIGEDGEEDEDGEMEDAPSEEQPVVAPSEVLKGKMEEKLADWEALSAKDRYSTANPYISFVKTAHDASHPERQSLPLPHASTWFDSSNKPTQPYYQTAESAQTQGDGDNDDDDLITTSVRISTKCPITTLTFTDPVTSTRCPHSFERSAIEHLLRQTRNTSIRDRATGRQAPAVPCPECRTLLTKDDLRDDPILLRKVKRIVAQEARLNDEEEESDDEPSSSSRQQLNPKGDVENGVRATQNRAGMKKERVSAKGPGMDTDGTGEVLVPATQQNMIVDLEDGDDEATEDDELAMGLESDGGDDE